MSRTTRGCGLWTCYCSICCTYSITNVTSSYSDQLRVMARGLKQSQTWSRAEMSITMKVHGASHLGYGRGRTVLLRCSPEPSIVRVQGYPGLHHQWESSKKYKIPKPVYSRLPLDSTIPRVLFCARISSQMTYTRNTTVEHWAVNRESEHKIVAELRCNFDDGPSSWFMIVYSAWDSILKLTVNIRKTSVILHTPEQQQVL